MRFRCLLLFASLLLASRAHADVPLYQQLNSLERTTVDAVLAERGLRLDHSPEGKVFGRLIVVSLDVFQQDTAFLTWANIFHVVTRPHVVEDEVLWQPGHPFDRALVEETVRNLRLDVNYSVVAMVPVFADDPGTVDILAVTRDTWSLRLSTNFAITGGVVEQILVILTERNLAGRHKQIAAVMDYRLATVDVGPMYYDPRLFRSRLYLYEQLLFSINHDTGDLEGTINAFEIGLPLYSLDSRWGFLVAESHDFTVNRSFVGGELRQWDNPDTPDEEQVPWEVDVRELELDAVVRYGLGSAPRHVFTFGYGYDLARYDLVASIGDGASIDEATNDAFKRANLPRDQIASFVQGSYHLFAARYAAVANYQTFALAEDLSLGYDLVLTAHVGPEFLGSDADFVRSSLSVGYTAVIGGPGRRFSERDAAVLSGSVGVGGRWEPGRSGLIDEAIEADLHLATPLLAFLRVHVGGSALFQLNRVNTGLQEVGGSNGLRGYPAGAFIGESRAVGHVEVRTLPLEILSLFFGLVAFFDAGTIYDRGETPPFLSDVGLGLRLMAPQLQRVVYRFDYAFPTSGPDAFFPGVFTLGVEQVF